MRPGAHEGMAQVLKPLVKWATNELLAQQWLGGETEAVSTVESALSRTMPALGKSGIQAQNLESLLGPERD